MKNAIGVGPLALVGVQEAARATSADFMSRHGRYFAFKLLAVVSGSRGVTVAVSKEQRGQFTLLYDPRAAATKDGFRFAAGNPVVTFKACGRGTQYNGGFLARRPGCLTLEVQVAELPRTHRISLEVGSRCGA
jgi:hypothetical protein